MKVRQIYKVYNDHEQSYEHYYIDKEQGVGVTVAQIDYHEPQGEGDAHYCDVNFSDGSKRRVFKLDSIDFFPEVAL